MAITHTKLPAFTSQDIQRFKNKIKFGLPDECWEYKTATSHYGQFWFRNRNLSAHRVAYYLHTQEDPGELQICHTCDNPPCCNPAHLFKGTQKDNMEDKCRKGRQATGLRNGAYTMPHRVPRGDRAGSRRSIQSRPRGDNHPLRNPKFFHKLNHGEKCHTVKLTREDVFKIRAEYQINYVPFTETAKRYNVNPTTIEKIVKRKTWKHI